MKDENVLKMEKFFERDRFASHCGVKIEEVNSNYAICSAKISDFTLNAADCVQGGMVFTLADLTFSTLANFLHPNTVTQFASITYLNPAVGETLYAKAWEVSRTKHNAVYNVEIYNEKNLIVATCQASGFILG